MYLSNLRSVILLFLLIISFSCKPSEKDTICTAMFATVSIEITGSTLDSHYTIRTATGDTLHFQDVLLQNTYTVLDDNYQPVLEGKTETFRFEGIKSGNKVVSEDFVISADLCHISKVSGKNSINI